MLTRKDLASSLDTRLQRVLFGIAFGIICAVAMILLRSLINLWAPISGPFALVYPTVLIATLYGRWQAGLVSYTISFIWAWWLVLPEVRSFYFVIPSDPSRVAINASAAMVVVILAEAWRRAVMDAAAARDAEIERRDMLMAELEHRTKNNFSLVASLLGLQKRRIEDPSAAGALDEAIGRVHTFASAYANLTATHGEGVQVAMREYLVDVIRQISDGAFAANIKVVVSVEDCQLPRQTAVAIGLFANEALINCAKYAFPDEREGIVDISFACMGEGWSLTVRDNGVGEAQVETAAPARPLGLGSGLMTAFAQQARAEFTSSPTQSGRTVSLVALG